MTGLKNFFEVFIAVGSWHSYFASPEPESSPSTHSFCNVSQSHLLKYTLTDKNHKTSTIHLIHFRVSRTVSSIQCLKWIFLWKVYNTNISFQCENCRTCSPATAICFPLRNKQMFSLGIIHLFLVWNSSASAGPPALPLRWYSATPYPFFSCVKPMFKRLIERNKTKYIHNFPCATCMCLFVHVQAKWPKDQSGS